MTVQARTGAQYAYAFGRIGVLQQNLPDQSDIDRMTGSHTKEELLQILSEVNFTAPIAQGLSTIDDLIPAMERWLRKEVESMVDEAQRSLFDILWLKEDGALLAFLLKKHHRLTSDISRQPRSSISAHDVESVQHLVERGQPDALPDHIVEFVQQVKELKNPTPMMIDTLVAQYVANRQTALARRSGSKAIQHFVAHTIDLQNIRTAKRLGSTEATENHYLRGGEIDPKRLSSNKHQLAGLIRSCNLPSDLADAVEHGDDTSITLERGLAKAIAHSVAEMRETPLTIEPVFAYAVIALSQIRVLRTILIGKSTGLTPAEISTMLPPFLSASPFLSA